MRSLNFKKFFLQSSPMPHIKPIIHLAYEATTLQEGSTDHQPESIELYGVALKCLINLICLPLI